MSQPPQGGPGREDGQPPQGQGGPGPQGYPPQPGQPPYAGGPGPQRGGYGVPPGGPYQQPYQQGPYQRGPYAPVPGQAPQKQRTGLFVLIGAGALALILAVVAVAVNLGGRDDTAGGGTTSGGTANAPAAATASDAVTGYLQAVARGDAQAAVAYAVDPSTVTTTSMTPEVLAASAKRAPMTHIQVPAVSDPDATTVPASYKLGSTEVSTSIEVMKTSGDAWKLLTVATELDLTAVQDDALPLLINGTTVKPGPFSVLPGSYRFTTGQRNFDYGSHPDLVVRYPSDFPDISRLQPRISSKGQSSALSAVKKSWSSCLDKHAQKPKGCPNQFRYQDFNFKDSTVRWTRKGSDPFKKIKPSYLDATTVQYLVERDLALRGTCTSQGRTGTCTGTLKGGNVQVEARLSGSNIKVEWLV